MSLFQRAERKKAKLRLGLCGPEWSRGETGVRPADHGRLLIDPPYDQDRRIDTSTRRRPSMPT